MSDLRDIKDDLKKLQDKIDDKFEELSRVLTNDVLVPLARHEERLRLIRWVISGISTVLLTLVVYLIKEKV